MDRGSSVIVTKLERELPSTVLTEYAEDSALFEAEVYHPATITKLLKSKGFFVSRRGVTKFYQEYT